MNFSPGNQDNLSLVLRQLGLAEDAEPDRYGEEPDPLTERVRLRKLAADLCGQALVCGLAVATSLAKAEDKGLSLEVVRSAEDGEFTFGILRDREDLVGFYPWSSEGGLDVEPAHLIDRAIDFGDLLVVEQKARLAMGVAPADAGDVPWSEDPASAGDGGAS